ncbi:hypothetical protein [Halostreptopolyspora alba]|uniref:Uncharacterized protein n=1 Tax=Halostreptopolyspora alba TaxID=2487137 RepID=A0A3N0E3G0_9ACTN|nr:hypothetical protein EFW17_19635 [Nocardiopsaceae bacterium YIM 96095]
MRRHLFGLLAGLLCAPLLWFGTAWAAAEVSGGVRSGDFTDGLAMPGVGALMAIGVLGGLLAGSRLSPLAALLAGAVPLGFCLWPLLDLGSFETAMPGWLDADSMFHPLGPAFPVVLPLGTLLLISALLPSRWRSTGAAPPPRPVPDDQHPHDRYPAAPAPDDPPSSAPEHGEPAGTTTPFQRDPSGGPPRPR